MFNLHNFNLINRNCLKSFLFCFFVFCIFLFNANASRAATFTVTRSDDRNAACDSGVDCSLREAVSAANAQFQNDTISFAAGLSVITLTAEIEVVSAGSLMISGAGANLLTIDGGAGTNRIFYLNNADVTISGLTMQGGNGDGAVNSGVGGAIYSSGGQVTLDSVAVKNNSAVVSLGGGAALGGGTAHIVNSTFSGNASNQCGGIYFNGMSLFLANSTISGNMTAAGANGDAKGAGLCNGGTTTIRSSTITNNSSTGVSSGSGGVFNFQGTLNIGNTIISGNTANSYPEIRNENTVMSAGNNLIGDSANDSTDTGIAITFQASDILDTPPKLSSLNVANGGSTPTHALLAGSPAMDKGSNALAVDPFNNNALTTDQRGSTRIVDGNADSAAIIDIGAFEVQTGPTAANVTVSGRVQTSKGQGIRNVLISLTDSDGETRTVISNAFGYYHFTDVPAGETYIFNIRAKRCQFAQPTQVRSISEDIADFDFIAVETQKIILNDPATTKYIPVTKF